jgi:ABC-type nitrate/sulfonate/bicarbonate transport system permease component
MKNLFHPFKMISRQTFIIMVILQVVITLTLWHTAADGLIPKPVKVAEAFFGLLHTRLLMDNILVSLMLTLKAMFYSIIITLFFSYL